MPERVNALYSQIMEDCKSQIVYPIRLDRSVYERLKVFAARQDLNAAQVIRRAIKQTTEPAEKKES